VTLDISPSAIPFGNLLHSCSSLPTLLGPPPVCVYLLIRVHVHFLPSFLLLLALPLPPPSSSIPDPRFTCPSPPCAFIHRSGFENEEAVVKHNGDFSSETLIAFINANKLRS